MIVFMTLCYVAILAVLVKLKILPNSMLTWLSTAAWIVLLFVALFIPMQWGAPAGPAKAYTYTVQIVPNVAGPVAEVPVEGNTPLKQGDVLFTIDPTTYQASVDSIQAQLDFQRHRLEQYQKLASTAAGSRFQVEETEALVRKLEAELEEAKWKLEQTTVRAPLGRLRDHGRVAARPAGDDSAAAAGDDIRRHLAHLLRRRNPADLQAAPEGRPAGRGRIQDPPGQDIHGKGRGDHRGDKLLPGPDGRHRIEGRADRRRALLGPHRTGRWRIADAGGGRNRRDLHLQRDRYACHPQGDAADEELFEFHQSMAVREIAG